MTTITLTAEDFQFLTAFVSSTFAAVVIFLALPRTDGAKDTTFARLQETLGAKRWPAKWFLAVVVFWAVLALCLFGGLIATIGMIVHQLFFAEDFTANRFPLIQLAALTATLGAVVALPFTVLRLKLTQEQTETAKAVLIKEQIEDAAADLHARRQFSIVVDKTIETVWQDDKVRRNTAIQRLETLAVSEPTSTERVRQLLDTYLRELASQTATESSDLSFPQIGTSSDQLDRSDFSNALQAFWRLPTKSEDSTRTKHTAGANLEAASLKRATLRKANLQGANLRSANLAGADLRDVLIDRKTVFEDASLKGAAFQNVDLSEFPDILANLEDIFADATVTIPSGTERPKHWPNEKLSNREFRAKWQSWAASKGIDIPEFD